MQNLRSFLFGAFLPFASLLTATQAEAECTATGLEKQDTSFVLSAEDGRRLRVTSYGDAIVRMQTARADEVFVSDARYEMVVSHDWGSTLAVDCAHDDRFRFSTERITIVVDSASLRATFFQMGSDTALLTEAKPVAWSGDQISAKFVLDDEENFTALGHSFYGREASLNLKGQRFGRNYGAEQIEQAPLIVPFYMSSKGYGVFLNSTFPNSFSFGANGQYSFGINTHGFDGQMDYFFIAGPSFAEIINNYTQLTGRPRLPPKSMFGLQLSDKGHDHNSPTPSDEAWWRAKIAEHRASGFPLDHVVNDNRWRAAGGKRCESKLAWDHKRYPDPGAYGDWLKENGLVTTLDFNRCIAEYTDGWDAEFNLPSPGAVDFSTSAPDLTHPGFRKWFWDAFYSNALKPDEGYPGDALWIDEFDEQGAAPRDQILFNGASSAEMRNYWFFLIAKALVEEGWDKSEMGARPFVWVRGMTAGAQRYATLWSGDIYPNYTDMKAQIRAMQLAGLSGFPFWGHDAGGFYDWDAGQGPDETLYQQWGMALGAFSPIWKPHGMGQSRWPLDRSDASQKTARTFAKLRYRLMPYTYSMAHKAAETGTPIVRPMMFDAPESSEAWAHDLQFMYGDSMLIAPQTDDTGTVAVWLPEGIWYDYASNQKLSGERTRSVSVSPGDLPIYVKAGGILPFRDYAQSTAFIDKTHLGVTIFAGEDGSFELVEDDDRTEEYRDGAVRTTTITYQDASETLKLSTKGTYQGAPEDRRYTISFVGVPAPSSVLVNGQSMIPSLEGKIASIRLASRPADEPLEIVLVR